MSVPSRLHNIAVRYAQLNATELGLVVAVDGAAPVDAAVAAALGRQLRLLSLGVDAPTTVGDLPYRMVGDALAVVASLEDHAAWLNSSGVRRWLEPEADWAQRLKGRRRQDTADLTGLLTGQRVATLHVDYGYPDTGPIHATLVMESGEVLVIDCRDEVSGYDHALLIESVDAESWHRIGPVSLSALAGHRIEDVVDFGGNRDLEIVLVSGSHAFYVAASDECCLVWHSSPVEEGR